MVKNCMEDMVDDFLPIVLQQYEEICRCYRCIDDIKAITLNNLKPLYVATQKGNLYVKVNKLNNQFKADIIREITRAVEIVKNNPRHKFD